MSNRKSKIATEKEYNAVMKKIDALMRKGEKNLTRPEAQQIEEMALLAQAYEKTMYKVHPPKTLEGLIELKMYERKLRQKELASLLGMAEPKLSQIMTRKRKPDLVFLKAVHKLLGIDGNILLEYA
ncbi:MAG TPA: helix-turn-helix domain-containing protein [Puia sp.]|nr:helix-turn-helix domain-containing protein [Puia sp.]